MRTCENADAGANPDIVLNRDRLKFHGLFRDEPSIKISSVVRGNDRAMRGDPHMMANRQVAMAIQDSVGIDCAIRADRNRAAIGQKHRAIMNDATISYRNGAPIDQNKSGARMDCRVAADPDSAHQKSQTGVDAHGAFRQASGNVMHGETSIPLGAAFRTVRFRVAL